MYTDTSIYSQLHLFLPKMDTFLIASHICLTKREELGIFLTF